MQIVIDIPNAPIEDYQDLYHKIYGMAASEGLFDDKVKSQRALALKVVLAILGGIVDGTPLPKGHGRLKDIDWIDDNCPDYRTEDGAWCYKWEDINDAPTIIEADKGADNG